MSFLINPYRASAPPTDIVVTWRSGFAGGIVPDDTPTSTVLADLSAVGGTGSITFSEVADPDSKFTVSGTTLVLSATLDDAVSGSHSVTIRATDAAAATYDEVVSITVEGSANTGDGDGEPIAGASGPSGGMFDFPGLDLAGYQRIVIFAEGIQAGVTAATLRLRLYIGGTLQTTGYRFTGQSLNYDGTSAGLNQNTSAGHVELTTALTNTAGLGYSGRIEISNHDTNLYKLVIYDAARQGDTTAARHYGGGVLENTGTVTGVRLYTSTGGTPTLTAGKVYIYGFGEGSGGASTPATLIGMWVGGIS